MTIQFSYENKNYQLTIPAGTNIQQLLEDEDYFYGFFGLAGILGLQVTEL